MRERGTDGERERRRDRQMSMFHSHPEDLPARLPAQNPAFETNRLLEKGAKMCLLNT